MAWVTAHPGYAFLIYVAFMSAVQALPRPTEGSNGIYTWLYGFAHIFSANWKLAIDPVKSTPFEKPPAQEVKAKAKAASQE